MCLSRSAGVEVLRTLNDLNVETEAPLEVVVWTNEEGSRFPPCMMGSGVFAEKFSLADTLAKLTTTHLPGLRTPANPTRWKTSTQRPPVSPPPNRA